MSFNPHYEYRGKHATFSPSQCAWLNYDEEKIFDKVMAEYRVKLGTLAHECASYEIQLRHKISSRKQTRDILESYIAHKYEDEYGCISRYGKELIEYIPILPKEVFDTMRSYISDGTQYNMTTEQPLAYSDRIFGTADAISFENGYLRIHDLKTGSRPAHMNQLMTYATLYCLEYKRDPHDISIELRIYQNGEIIQHLPEPSDILAIKDQIVKINKVVNRLKEEIK